MASNNCNDSHATRTRLQEATEKRKILEQLKEQAELKRQKKMFAPRKLIGPRDILVNSNLPKIKLEDVVGCSSSLKQESSVAQLPEPSVVETPHTGHNDSIPQVKLEVDEDFQLVVKVEDTLDLEDSTFDEQISLQFEAVELNENLVSEVKQNLMCSENSANENLAGIVSVSEDGKISRHIELLKNLVGHKDQEIKLLMEIISDFSSDTLENQSCSTIFENEHIQVDDFSTNTSDITVNSSLSVEQQVAQLTSELKMKDAKIKVLSAQIFELQNGIFANTAQPPFEMVLPFLYPKFKLNDILACRRVCHGWEAAVDTFLSTHPSVLPFDQETHLNDERKVKRGRIPTWIESPLNKLANAYKFSNLTKLSSFIRDIKGKIIGSSVWLDNISIDNHLSVNILNTFFTSFGTHIKYLKLRQRVEFPDFKLKLLIDRVNLCLGQLPNLVGFTLVFFIDKEIVQTREFLRICLGNEICKNWEKFCSYPNLEKLESLFIDVESLGGAKELFLNIFAKSLINSSSEQLKQVSIIADYICDLRFLHETNFPQIVQLTIPPSFLRTTKLYKNVKKCTFTNQSHILKPNLIVNIQNVLPNLVCLGFKCQNTDSVFITFIKPEPFLLFSDVQTLELENCSGVSFTLLGLFPELHCLKIITERTNKYYKYDKEALCFRTLWQIHNFYKTKTFWEKFPKISLVTLAFSDAPQMFLAWTREGYAKYWYNINTGNGHLNVVKRHPNHRYCERYFFNSGGYGQRPKCLDYE